MAGLQAEFCTLAPRSRPLGVLLHHEFHADPASLAIIASFVDWLAQKPGLSLVGLPQALARIQGRV